MVPINGAKPYNELNETLKTVELEVRRTYIEIYMEI